MQRRRVRPTTAAGRQRSAQPSLPLAARQAQWEADARLRELLPVIDRIIARTARGLSHADREDRRQDILLEVWRLVFDAYDDTRGVPLCVLVSMRAKSRAINAIKARVVETIEIPESVASDLGVEDHLRQVEVEEERRRADALVARIFDLFRVPFPGRERMRSIALGLYEGKSQAEIARELGVDKATVTRTKDSLRALAARMVEVER